MMQFPFPVNKIKAALLLMGAVFCAVTPTFAAQRFDCVIVPNRTVLIGSSVTGVLTEVTVGRGDKITKGQTLARLEDRVERASVALQETKVTDNANLVAQETRVDLARERVNRAEKLFKKRTISRDVLEQARAEYSVSSAEVVRLKLEMKLELLELTRSKANLELRTIVSSMDGVVAQQVLSEGEFVNQDAHILRVVSIDPLHVEVFLPVSYFPQIAVGQTANVSPLEPVGQVFDASVTVIDRVFDATSNTFGIRLVMNNPNSLLPAGQRCKVDLEVKPAPSTDADLAAPTSQ